LRGKEGLEEEEEEEEVCVMKRIEKIGYCEFQANITRVNSSESIFV